LKRSNRLILLIGIFLAIVAFVAIIFLLGGGGDGGDQNAGRNEVTYAVAAQDIPIGTTLTNALVEMVAVDATQLPPGAITNESAVIGQRITTQLTDGQLITSAAWSPVTVDPNIGRLLDPGRRAMSVRVDQVSGVGTLIKPGDRVDVVLGIAGADKFPVVSADPETDQITVVPGINATSVKSIIQNLEVVGTLLPPPTEQQGGDQEQPTDPNAPTLNEQNQIVILAVTAQESEVIRFAQIDGSITLVLRSPDDDEAPPDATTGITLRQLVDEWAVIPPQIVETVLPTQE
jgi:pilus assembly protein CpaB